jgi:hypothetical protein
VLSTSLTKFPIRQIPKENYVAPETTMRDSLLLRKAWGHLDASGSVPLMRTP